MLYLIFGKDTFRSREKLKEVRDFFLKGRKNPLGDFWFSNETFSEELFKTFLYSENFFVPRTIIVLDGILAGDILNFGSFENLLKDCADSQNIFIFWEEELKTGQSDIFKKYAAKVQEFKPLPKDRIFSWLRERLSQYKIKAPASFCEGLFLKFGSNLWALSKELDKLSLKEASPEHLYFKENVNLFHLADALAKRDLSAAFVLYHKALFGGAAPEEIFWKFVWQIKNLLLLKNYSSYNYNDAAKLTGLHPYVAKKCLSALHLFTGDELRNYSKILVKLWHESKRGKNDLALGIEKFILNLKSREFALR